MGTRGGVAGVDSVGSAAAAGLAFGTAGMIRCSAANTASASSTSACSSAARVAARRWSTSWVSARTYRLVVQGVCGAVHECVYTLQAQLLLDRLERTLALLQPGHDTLLELRELHRRYELLECRQLLVRFVYQPTLVRPPLERGTCPDRIPVCHGLLGDGVLSVQHILELDQHARLPLCDIHLRGSA